MKKYINKIIIILALALFSMILMPGKVHAGLQANKGGTSLGNTTADTFFTQIRGMEVGTLGLPTQNAQDGIDCHMIKNTEWGSIVLLTVSSEYGVKPADNSNNSTTGNDSGIFQMAGNKYEYTANFITGNTQGFANKITNGGKYSNEYSPRSSGGYTNEGTMINGDALNLRRSYSGWNTDYPVLASGNGSIFGVHAGNPPTDISGGRAVANGGCLAAVVCGSGL